MSCYVQVMFLQAGFAAAIQQACKACSTLCGDIYGFSKACMLQNRLYAGHGFEAMLCRSFTAGVETHATSSGNFHACCKPRLLKKHDGVSAGHGLAATLCCSRTAGTAG